MKTFIRKRFPLSKQSSLLVLGAALAVATTALPARAGGVVVSETALSTGARSGLSGAIAKARGTEPAAFEAVRKAKDHVHGSAARQRNAKPSVTRELRRLGKAALYPLLELVAFQAKQGSLSDEEWRALGDGALQALAVLHEPKAAPVLAAAFLNASEPSWVEHAAEGLGMLCGESERNLLLSNLGPASPRRAAAITGLGYCRRREVAEKLASELQDPSPEIAMRAARALGYVGSSWALAVDKTVSPEESDQIRSFASSVLIRAYAQREKPVREVIYRAVTMVEHPSAAAEIDREKAHASGEVRLELERLAHRLELDQKRAKH